MTKSVLITGASGFIGYNVVEKFINNGYFVYAIVHKNIKSKLQEFEKAHTLKILKADLGDYASVDNLFNLIYESNINQNAFSLDTIIHCAGRASDVGWEREFKKTNFDSVVNLVKFVKKYNIGKFIFISTTDVYGLRDFCGEAERELHYASDPSNNYPKYKILAEKWLKTHLDKNKYCILRPAAVYGEDDPTITQRIKNFMNFCPYIIHFGRHKGNNTWPAVDVKEVALACYISAILPEAMGEEINIIDKTKITIDEFYRLIGKKYFPNKKFKSVKLPWLLGLFLGHTITKISNILNLKKPFLEPSLYALYSVSYNLNFSSSKYYKLRSLFFKSHNKI